MVAGVRLTFGSTLFHDNVADQDDHVVTGLRQAGIVITGKTATPEFGLPCYTETRIGPPARTPWDLTRSAGGSSGGAAAAVAAGLAPAAQGSDGGGSIRIPSSVCGLFGIKPTRGRISGGPLLPDLAGLSIDGPIARTVEDAALLLDAMTGNYPGDMYTLPPLPAGETFRGYAGREPGRLRIARSLQNVVEGAQVHPDCVAAYEEASALLAGLGHEVEDIDMPFGPDVGADVRDALVRDGHAGPDRPGAGGPAAADHPLPARARPAGPGAGAAVRPGVPAGGHADRGGGPEPVRRGALAHAGRAPGAGRLLRRGRIRPRTSSGRSGSPRTPPCTTCPGSRPSACRCTGTPTACPIGVMLAGRMGEEGTLISCRRSSRPRARGGTGTRRSGEPAVSRGAAPAPGLSSPGHPRPTGRLRAGFAQAGRRDSLRCRTRPRQEGRRPSPGRC